MEKEDRREIDLMTYWQVIARRKNILIVFAGVLVLLVAIYSFTVPPKYKPTATVLIEEPKSKLLNVEDEFGFMGYRTPMQDLIYLNTQLNLLQSTSLAERVVISLDLLSHPQFGAKEKKGKSVISFLRDIFTLKWLRGGKKAHSDISAMRDPIVRLAQSLKLGLDVAPVRDTSIVKLSYTSSDPVVATQIVNAFADEFINYSVDIRFKTTKQARDFLSEQIAILREELSTKERELQRYSKEKDLRFLSDSESAALNEYTELHRAFAQAQVDRINAQATYRQLRELDIESPPQMVNNGVIRELTSEYTRMKNDYTELSEVYGPNHPDMIKRKASLDSMKSNLQDEVQNAVKAAEADYRAALRKENDLKAATDRQVEEVAKTKSNAILYNSIKIEIEHILGQLSSLEGMRKDTEVSTKLAGLKTGNISIVDYAQIPLSPASPKKMMNILLAIILGIGGGIALCFIVEYLDNTIKGSEDVERLVGLPSLGMIPLLNQDGVKKRSFISGLGSSSVYGKNDPGRRQAMVENANIELINHRHPNFAISEDYRTVRTSILLSQDNSLPKTLAFSSSLPQEGKTVTVANTAVAFAQLGKRVIIIDADLRRPRMHRLFNVRNTKGLSGYLTDQDTIEEIVQKTSVENVWLIPSGPIPPNPAELLESDRMRDFLKGIKQEIDFIFIDTPPVLAVVDSLIIGSIAGNVILITQPEKTNRRAFLSSVERLKQSSASIIGVIFNKTAPRTKQYHDKSYYYEGYYSAQE